MSASFPANMLNHDSADSGPVLTDKWGSTPSPTMPIGEITERVDMAGAWIVMKHVEIDPAWQEQRRFLGFAA